MRTANVRLGLSSHPLFLDPSAPQYETGDSPWCVVVGDFNGDGKADLAIANSGLGTNNPGSVSVILGNGDSTFQTHVDYQAGINPLSLTAGDFNADDKLDLAVTNWASTTISVLLGNGDGTFLPHVDYATATPGDIPWSVALGDFNSDGKPDLAVANFYSSVSVLLGNGDGTFQTCVAYPAGKGPHSVVVGDFNGDGKADLAVANSSDNSVSVLLGNGDGTFQTRLNYQTGVNPVSLTIGDFNGDGKADLVVTNWASATLSVLLGNGNGTFAPRVDYATGNGPSSVAVGDFNEDGHADFAETNLSDTTVGVLLGNGNGSFQARVDYANGDPRSVAVGDFNGDGKEDLALANEAVNSLSVLLGNGDGTFAAVPRYATGNTPRSLAVGDFNTDGKPDLVTANAGDRSVSVLLGNGNGTFQAHVNHATGNGPQSVAVGDFDGDGNADLAVANWNDNSVSVLLGNGNGTFQTHVDYAAGIGPQSVAVGDFNGDGKADLVVVNWNDITVSVLLGNGDGTFQTHVDYPVGGWPVSVAVGDVNGDGKSDLAVTIDFPYCVVVLLGNGDGTFQTNNVPGGPTGSRPWAVAVGDLNADGNADLAVTHEYNSVAVLLNNGNNLFFNPVDYLTDVDSLIGTWSTVDVEDIDVDGKADLIVTNEYSSVSVLPGNGDGTFQSSINYARGQSGGTLALVDVNGDGARDVAFITTGNGISTLLNTRGTVLEIRSSGSPSNITQSTTFTVSVRASLDSNGIGIPSGAVTFMDGEVELGPKTLDASGAASFSTSTLNAGTHIITAVYHGDAEFNPHTSMPFNQIIYGPDFLISAIPANADVKSGSSIDFNPTFTGSNGFEGQVSISCSVSPTPAFAPTCTVNPQSVTLALNASATAKLTIATTGPSVSLHPDWQIGSRMWCALCFPVLGLALVGAGSNSCRRNKILAGVLLAFASACFSLPLACGGSSTKNSGGGPSSSTPPGKYQVTVKANSGSLAHSSAVAITVR